MPLLLTSLTGSPGLPGAANRDYPATGTACANEWADALGAYAAGIVPASTAVTAATTTLRASLTTAFNGPVGSRLSAFTTAMGVWAAAIGAGMAGFVAVPPLSATLATAITAAFTTPAATRSAGVATMAGVIDTWMRTGTAAVPPAAPVVWA